MRFHFRERRLLYAIDSREANPISEEHEKKEEFDSSAEKLNGLLVDLMQHAGALSKYDAKREEWESHLNEQAATIEQERTKNFENAIDRMQRLIDEMEIDEGDGRESILEWVTNREYTEAPEGEQMRLRFIRPYPKPTIKPKEEAASSVVDTPPILEPSGPPPMLDVIPPPGGEIDAPPGGEVDAPPQMNETAQEKGEEAEESIKEPKRYDELPKPEYTQLNLDIAPLSGSAIADLITESPFKKQEVLMVLRKTPLLWNLYQREHQELYKEWQEAKTYEEKMTIYDAIDTMMAKYVSMLQAPTEIDATKSLDDRTNTLEKYLPKDKLTAFAHEYNTYLARWPKTMEERMAPGAIETTDFLAARMSEVCARYEAMIRPQTFAERYEKAAMRLEAYPVLFARLEEMLLRLDAEGYQRAIPGYKEAVEGIAEARKWLKVARGGMQRAVEAAEARIGRGWGTLQQRRDQIVSYLLAPTFLGIGMGRKRAGLARFNAGYNKAANGERRALAGLERGRKGKAEAEGGLLKTAQQYALGLDTLELLQEQTALILNHPELRTSQERYGMLEKLLSELKPTSVPKLQERYDALTANLTAAKERGDSSAISIAQNAISTFLEVSEDVAHRSVSEHLPFTPLSMPELREGKDTEGNEIVFGGEKVQFLFGASHPVAGVRIGDRLFRLEAAKKLGDRTRRANIVQLTDVRYEPRIGEKEATIHIKGYAGNKRYGISNFFEKYKQEHGDDAIVQMPEGLVSEEEFSMTLNAGDMYALVSSLLISGEAETGREGVRFVAAENYPSRKYVRQEDDRVVFK